MQDVFVSRCRQRPCFRWVGVILGVVLFSAGCSPSATTKKSEKASTEASTKAEDSRVQRNLQNAFETLRPEKLGVASGSEQAIAVLNEWAKGAKAEAEKRNEPWEPRRPHSLLKSLPKEWLEQFSLEHFVERDAAYLRDCVWANRATKFGAGDAEKDLDVVVTLFEFVVRNLVLIPRESRQAPLCPFDAMMLGRGTAADRAWAFAELLRQRNIDSVILSPRRVTGDAGDDASFLVGVLFDKDILLFDPTLGLPVPGDVAEPKSALLRFPASLRQVQRDPGLLTQLARDSGGRFTLTAKMLEAPLVELICHSEQLAVRMKRLQGELSGEQSVIVSDPLEDADDQQGLWSRVAKHSAAAWSPEDVAIWSYPELVRDSATRITSDQQKELTRLSLSLGAPIRVQRFLEKANEESYDLEFGKPERMLMKRRMEHVVGRWADAVPGYLASQLFDVDPPTAKGLEIVSSDGKDRRPAGIKTVAESQTLRFLMMQPKYAPIRKVHLLAGDDACFWQALCQFEQNRWEATVDQCKVYNKQHSDGGWFAANQTLMAVAYVKQKMLKEAVRALKEIDADDPLSAEAKVLTARWQRLLTTPTE